jgi:hypothetical protein
MKEERKEEREAGRHEGRKEEDTQTRIGICTHTYQYQYAPPPFHIFSKQYRDTEQGHPLRYESKTTVSRLIVSVVQ